MKRGQDCLISETFDRFVQKQSEDGDDECFRDFLFQTVFSLVFVPNHHISAKIDKRNCNLTKVSPKN